MHSKKLLMKRLLTLRKKEGIFVNLLAEPNAKLQVFRTKKISKEK